MHIRELLAMTTLLDRVLAGTALLAVLAAFLLVTGSPPGSRVEVRAGGHVVFAAPLDEARRVEVSGPLGTTLLEIKDGAVRVIHSPCRQQVCVRMGAIHYHGEVLACVPNRVVVQVVGKAGGNDPAYDFISR